MSPSLSAAGTAALDKLLSSLVSSRTLPAMHLGAVTAAGPLYANQLGDKNVGQPEKGTVNEETTFQLYSATKLVTAVAVAQLVERGEVSLDDGDLVHRLCPELNRFDNLKGYDDAGAPIWQKRRGQYTLRNLLAHTNGLGYVTKNKTLARWAKETGHPLFWSDGSGVEALAIPPTFDPDTAWEYGLGNDWAGVVVERFTGLNLEEYFQKYIFRPLGITDVTFYPTDEAISRMQGICKRAPDGTIEPTKFIVDPHRLKSGQLSGGAGLFGTMRGYMKFLQGVLACAEGAQSRGIVDKVANGVVNGHGSDTVGPTPILSPAGYKLLFENCLPPPGKNNSCTEDIYIDAGDQVSNDPRNVDLGRMEHSIGFPMTTRDSPHGRKAGSGMWGGAGQTLYWVDPTTGVAGLCFTQLRVPNPDPYFEAYNRFERTLYDHLV